MRVPSVTRPAGPKRSRGPKGVRPAGRPKDRKQEKVTGQPGNTHRRLTQQELIGEATARFGADLLKAAFVCPRCGDVATIGDFQQAGDAGLAGQACIGRLLGALTREPSSDGGRSQAQRGCDWAAFGLLPGPWTIVMPDGKEVPSFALADVPQ